MCIIAVIPQRKQISKSTLQRCWNNNQHGGGFMFTDGNKIITHKEMSSFKRYWKSFVSSREQYPKSTFVCHFRISTHGKVNEDNCHPFHVNKKLGFAHNGIIRNAPTSSDYSDTYMFNETILKHLPNDFLNNEAIVSLIKEYIGSGSKLAFLSHDNTYTIINESMGQWDNGIWFSNGGYKEYDYFDRGGVRVQGSWGSGSYSNTNAKPKSSYVQQNIGYNSNLPKYDFNDWTSKLKNDKKLDNTIVKKAMSDDCDCFDYTNKYLSKCDFCNKELHTYTEKENKCCQKCFISFDDDNDYFLF
jgi:hypothetical protein